MGIFHCRKRIPTLFFFLSAIVIIFPAENAVAYDNETTHQSLARSAAENYNRQVANPSARLSEEQIGLLAQGAGEEDSPDFRSLNHFYDPINNTGLEIVPGISAGDSLVGWSRTQDSALFARDDAYAQAVEAAKRKDLKTAFTRLGAMLHLIADAGMPAHVRNDEHLEGDLYEAWVKRMQKINPSALRLDNPSIPRRVCSDMADCLRRLALATNRGYFSDDTISRQVYYEPYDSLVIREDGYARSAKRIVAKFNKALNRLELDETVLGAYWQSLSPEVIAYESEAIRIFMRDAGLAPKPQRAPQIASGVKIYDEEWPIPIIDESRNIPKQFLSPTIPSSVLQPSYVDNPSLVSVVAPEQANIPAPIKSFEGSAEGILEPNPTITMQIVEIPSEIATGTPTSTAVIDLPKEDAAPLPTEPDNYLWLFDEATGTLAVDNSGRAHMKTYADWAEGKDGACLKTDWQTQKFARALHEGLIDSGELTLAYDYRDGSDNPFVYGLARVVLMTSDFSEVAGIAPSTLSIEYIFKGARGKFTSSVPSDGAWHRLAIVYGKDNLKLYIDGQLREAVTGDFSLPTDIWEIRIIGENAPALIDNLTLWPKALTPN